MFFQLLSTIKANLVAKFMQSAYLCVIFHVKHKENFSRFKLDFQFFLKSKMVAKMAFTFGDVTGLQQHHHSKNIPHLVTKIKGFPGKIVSKYCNISKTPRRGSIHPPPPFPVPQWGYEFACTSKG